MNSAVLLILAVIVLAFGYRFYAKFLAAWLVRPNSNYSPPARGHADGHDYDACDRRLLLGQHVASLGATAAVVGSVLALIWGWVPAFLWVVVGGVTAAGTYMLAGLWLSVRHDGRSLAGIAADLIGTGVRRPLAILALVLLVVVNALFAVATARVLAAYPGGALASVLTLAIAWWFGRHLGRRPDARLALSSVLALLAALLAAWISAALPLALSGALNIQLRGTILFSANASAAWVIAALVAAYYCARLPLARLARPHGYIMALELGLMLVVVAAGLLLTHPPLAVPDFNTPAEGPGAVPWLFITLTTGAIAGFHLVAAGGVSARQIGNETDVRMIGYGGALADALVALTAILVVAAAFGSGDEWRHAYASWVESPTLAQALALYVDGVTRLATALGIGADFARAFAAAVLAGLSTVTLATGLRAQRQLLAEMRATGALPPTKREAAPHLLAVGVAAALALASTQDGHDRTLFALLGPLNQLLVICALVVIALFLRRLGRPALLVLAPLAALLAVTLWAVGAQLVAWLGEGAWLRAAGAAAALATMLWLVARGARQWRKTLSDAPQT